MSVFDFYDQFCHFNDSEWVLRTQIITDTISPTKNKDSLERFDLKSSSWTELPNNSSVVT